MILRFFHKNQKLIDLWNSKFDPLAHETRKLLL